MISLCLVAEGFSAESGPEHVASYLSSVTGIPVQQIAPVATTDDKSKWIVRFSTAEGEVVLFLIPSQCTQMMAITVTCLCQ